MQTMRERRIERVTAMTVALLENGGDLPPLPVEFRVDRSLRGFRHPTVTDASALKWLLACEVGRKPSGLLGYQDTYDFHTASDVRTVCYLAGKRRAVIDLLRFIQRESRAEGRRLIGSIDVHNQPLATVLKRLGATPTRTMFEDRA